jgi:hypothetical protein
MTLQTYEPVELQRLNSEGLVKVGKSLLQVSRKRFILVILGVGDCDRETVRVSFF